jgi:3-hydroxybutyryl-CoA dehydrogenase
MKAATQRIGVVGLGTMGLGIVQVFAQAGFDVIATDAHEPTRNAAKSKLSDTLAARVLSGKLAAIAAEQILSRFEIATHLNEFAATHLVIEAIAEKLEAKIAVFRDLEKYVAADCVLATNTSSLSVSEIANALTHPERVIGLHFFNPAAVMKLVELVVPSFANESAVALARRIAEATGKTVITCRDQPGFIVNRCARPFYGEALVLFEQGHKAMDIDASMLAAGYRLGPFSLIDLVGADINLAATQSLSGAMNNHPRYHVFDSLKAQVIKGALGRKSGRGFIYPNAIDASAKPSLEISLQIEAALINEAASLLEEGGLTTDDIDNVLKLGLNFPRGPFETLQIHGIDKVKSVLRDLEDMAPQHLTTRYLISPALENMA